MATSGVYNFNMTRDQIISAALRKVGQLDPEGQAATATQISNCSETLNAMIYGWNGAGPTIWQRKIGVVFLNSAQAIYTLGSNNAVGGDHASLTHAFTTLTAAASGTSLTVASITGISNGDNIGIQLTNGTLYWTTVNGTPSGSTISLSVGLTSGASVGAAVFAYTTKLARPIRVVDGYIRQTAGNDTPIRILSIEEYNRFGMKTSPGNTTQVLYQPLVGSGQLSLYPVPNNVAVRLFIEMHYPFQGFNSGGDTGDFSQEWMQAIIWGLALELGIEYGVTESRLSLIGGMSTKWFDMANATSQENSTFFQPDPMGG